MENKTSYTPYYVGGAIAVKIILIKLFRALRSKANEEEIDSANYGRSTETSSDTALLQSKPVIPTRKSPQVAVISDGRVPTPTAQDSNPTQDYHQYEIESPVHPFYVPNDPPPPYSQTVSYPDDTMKGSQTMRWLTRKLYLH